MPAKKPPEHLQKLLDYAWLGLGDVSHIEITNPLEKWTKEDNDDPVRRILRLMRKPEYFSFVCKKILNVELLPLQLVLLWELWNRPFPMLIGSRGMGKSFILALYAMLRALLCQGCKVVIVGSAFRQAKVVFEYCEKIWYDAPILRDLVGEQGRSGPRRDIDRCTMTIGESVIVALPLGDGCLTKDTLVTFEDGFGCISDGNNSSGEQCIIPTERKLWGNKQFRLSDESYCNGIAKTKIIRTRKGFKIEGTLNHKIRILRNERVVWERFDKLVAGDCVLVDRSNRWHKGAFKCSTDEAYALGLMIGDGCWTNPYLLGYASMDDELVSAVRRGTGFEFSKIASDKYHFVHRGKSDRSKWLDKWGLKTCRAREKVLPPGILRSSREAMAACLRGIFDTDGYVQIGKKKGGVTVGLTTTSERLAEQIQYILLHFGIVVCRKSRTRGNPNWNMVHELLITGKNTEKFAEQIGFGLSRKAEKITDGLNSKVRHSRCMETRQDDESIYYDEILSIEDSEALTFDVHVPNGHEYCANGFFSHNTKIRGQRANYIIADEFASIPREIFETVVSGFGVVSMDPISNVKRFARIRTLKEMGLWSEDMETQEHRRAGNQVVLSGTAYYDFNHFADYWRRWKGIVESKGDFKKLADVFGGEDKVDPQMNWRDYSVIRVPVELLPEGLHDARQVARSRATMHSGIFLMEYGACFAMDSQGFFRRKLIESCVVGRPQSPIEINGFGEVKFATMLRGNPKARYVYGIDPASEADNFAIIIIECHENHRRIVYGWTTNRRSYKEKIKHGIIKDGDYYGYCARKIRDLMKSFPCERIAIDSQGGGIAIMEALNDKDKMFENELRLWPVIDADKEKDTDGYVGKHIIEVINFAKSEWVNEANNGMKKDFEDKALLFPYYDPASFELAAEDDKRAGRVKMLEDGSVIPLYDTLEDAVQEVEDLKDELATIVHTQTANGRDRWDTPEIKLAANKKGRLRKDRYSALLMANMVARSIARAPETPVYNAPGGWARNLAAETPQMASNGQMYQNAPEWFRAESGAYGRSLRR